MLYLSGFELYSRWVPLKKTSFYSNDILIQGFMTLSNATKNGLEAKPKAKHQIRFVHCE